MLGLGLSICLPAWRRRREEAKQLRKSSEKLAIEMQDNLKMIARIKENLELSIEQVERFSVSDKEIDEAIKLASKLKTETFKECRAFLQNLPGGDGKRPEEIESLYRFTQEIQDFSESKCSPAQNFDQSIINKKAKLSPAKEILSKTKKALEKTGVFLNSLI